MAQENNPNFYDTGTLPQEKAQFSVQAPEEIYNGDKYTWTSKQYKRRVKILCFLVVLGILVIAVLAILLGVRHDTCQTGEPSEQEAETKEKAGQIEMALTLAHQFEAGMANSNSAIYKSTQTDLCREVHEALVAYKRFPSNPRIVCELESLRGVHVHSRNGFIKVSLKLTITGTYTIPVNSLYVQAVNTYIGTEQALGSFTVIAGSIAVVASSYTPIETTSLPPSTTDVTPSTTDVTPSTTDVTPSTTDVPSSIPPQTDMEMKSIIGRSSRELNITCSIHHAPLEWTELKLKSTNNNDVQAVAYPNGKTTQTDSSYTVELTRHHSTVTLDVIFPNTTTSCTTSGRYVCLLIANRIIITNTTAMVLITDDVSDLDISGNTTMSEGDRYMINCTATLARGSGELDLFIKSANDSEFVKTVERPSAILDDVVDVCHRYVTKAYTFLAENNQNGTEMKCAATKDILNSVKNSEVISITVEPADFSTVFHLKNATWIPAYNDVNSPEFHSFAEDIEHDTDYVYERSSVKDNYKGSKVVGLSQMNGVLVDMAIKIELTIVLTDSSNNVIRTTLNANDILGAFTQTLPTVAHQLPHSALAAVDTNDLVGDVVVVSDKNLPTDGCNAKTDMIFVLDASGSIGGNNFGLMKYFIRNFTATVNIGITALQIGVVKFDSHVYNEFWLNTYESPTQISNAIIPINYTEGSTCLDAALKYTKQNAFTTAHGARDGVGRVIIVMTDGASQDNPDQVAADLKREGVVIVSIGIGDGVNHQQLLSIAYNSTFVFQVNDFDVLINIKKIVQSSTCAVEEHH